MPEIPPMVTKWEPEGRARLLKHCDTMEKCVAAKQFDFGKTLVHKTECGTVGCIIGFLPKSFPDLIQWADGKINNSLWMIGRYGEWESVYYSTAAERIFGLGSRLSFSLFAPGIQRQHPDLPRPSEFASLKEVVAMLRKFVELTDAGEISSHDFIT